MARKKVKSKLESDFESGEIGLGGLFKGIGNLIDLVSKLDEKGISQSGEIKGLSKGARGVYGFSVRTMAGKPVVETFGNIKETAKGPTVEEVREPIVDIFDEKDAITVLVEMPGVSGDQIKVEVAGDILNLAASDTNRKYAKEVLLPARVKADSLKTSYNNGILEIVLQKEK